MRLQAEYIKYKDPSVSIPERVDDLMSRMTPEEKTAQLMQMGSHMILDNGKLNPQNCMPYAVTPASDFRGHHHDRPPGFPNHERRSALYD